MDTWYLQKRIIHVTGLLTGATNNDNFKDEFNKNETYIVWIDVCPDQESETSNGRDAGRVYLPQVLLWPPRLLESLHTISIAPSWDLG